TWSTRISRRSSLRGRVSRLSSSARIFPVVRRARCGRLRSQFRWLLGERIYERKSSCRTRRSAQRDDDRSSAAHHGRPHGTLSRVEAPLCSIRWRHYHVCRQNREWLADSPLAERRRPAVGTRQSGGVVYEFVAQNTRRYANLPSASDPLCRRYTGTQPGALRI